MLISVTSNCALKSTFSDINSHFSFHLINVYMNIIFFPFPFNLSISIYLKGGFFFL